MLPGSTASEVRRLRFAVDAMQTELAALREVTLATNHAVMALNHDIRSGAPEALPLFLGWADRVRLDVDAAIAAVQVIERQLDLADRVDRNPA